MLALALFSDYTLRTVALGSAALGITSGALGTFAVLRRQSLLGDAISHAALPGVALAFLLTGSKTSLVLVVGAALAGFLATLIVIGVVSTTRVKYDSALGIVLSVFFGFGLVLLTLIQRRPDASQAGLDRFLFGQAAALLQSDLVTMGILGGIALLLMLLAWKELKLLAFDEDYGRSLGFPMRALDVLLTALLVVAIVIGLQTVGVVLMAAMVIAPAAAARQWTDRLGTVAALAAGFGAAAGVSGAVLSSEAEQLPTGPTIVLCASVIVLASLLAAPRRGLLWRELRGRRDRRRLRLAAVLADLHALELQHPGQEHGHSERGHSAGVLSIMSGGAEASLLVLERRGLVKRLGDDAWALTDTGRAETTQ
ncbi:MAG: metal ABC transporter permease [Actinobacteria bacterium]|nr:metal ABC transporter permease [Actinomycetota bacterium]